MCCCILLFVFSLVHLHQKKNPYTHTFLSNTRHVVICCCSLSLFPTIVLPIFFFFLVPTSTTISQKKTSQTTPKSNFSFFFVHFLHMCISCYAPFLLRSMLDFFFFSFFILWFLSFSFENFKAVICMCVCARACV